jgi:hypothetical protein
MNHPLEHAMYGVSQLFLMPVLLAIACLFAYAFVALGAFVRQAWQRRLGCAAGFELLQVHAAHPALPIEQLEGLAHKRLEPVRVATRVAPMLGLVATMIPMGPALQAMSEGQMADVSRSLTVAFSAVILALIAAAITHVVSQVRRRWYAADLMVLPLPPSLSWAPQQEVAA